MDYVEFLLKIQLILTLLSRHSITATTMQGWRIWEGGGRRPLQILACRLTLSQPEGADIGFACLKQSVITPLYNIDIVMIVKFWRKKGTFF